VWVFLGVSLVIGVGLSHLASSAPDGLEKAMHALIPSSQQKQMKQQTTPLSAPLPDYQVPTLQKKRPFLSGSVAGALGVLAMFGLVLGVARFLSRKPSSHEQPS